MFDPRVVKQDFPILNRTVHGNELVYLDSAATSQKPAVVIDGIANYYGQSNANVHRGVHALSDESTQLWETSHATVAKFLGADTDELIITRNTTEAVNAVRYGWAEEHIQAGDVILVSLMEHHSNIVMWQDICEKKQAVLKFINITENGTLDFEHFQSLIINHQSSLKLINIVHVSNTLGTLNPVAKIVRMVKESTPQAKVLLDAAQSVPHIPVDFHELNVDFLAFSGHKMLGPMGIGGLLVKKSMLRTDSVSEINPTSLKLRRTQQFKPWLFGGGMIAEVTVNGTTYQDRSMELFTAGTPDVASLVGLAAACEYLTKLGMRWVFEHDQELVSYALEKLQEIPEVTIVGPTVQTSNSKFQNTKVPDSQQSTKNEVLSTSTKRIGSVAFIYKGVHAHDVAQILDSEGIAVRSGHHCTMPLHTHFGWQATTRASFQVYNMKEDVDELVKGLEKVRKIFGL